jgi:flagellin
VSIRSIDPQSFSNRFIALAMLNANRNMAKLVTGDRIFAAAEDPAGLVISEQLRSQIASLNAEITNFSSTSNKYTYTSGLFGEMHSQLVELRSLAVAASNDATNSPEAQAAYDRAAADLVARYNTTIAESEYNGWKLLDGSEGSLADVHDLSSIDLSNSQSAQDSIATIANAMREIERAQVDLGSQQKYELEGQRAQLEVTRENLIASESGIRDADFASVYLDYIVEMIKARVGMAMSSYARFSGVDVLKLLDRKDA